MSHYQGLCLSFQRLFPTEVLISDELVGKAVALFRHASLKEQWDRLNRDDNIKEGNMEPVVLPHIKYPLHICVTTPNFIGRTNSNRSAIFLSLKIPVSFFLLLPLLYDAPLFFTHLSLTALLLLPTLLSLIFDIFLDISTCMFRSLAFCLLLFHRTIGS